MEHKAFVFDFDGFTRELEGILLEALETDDVSGLKSFINDNLESLKDPYEGEPLDSDYESMMESKDVETFGDFALTKYYDPQEDIGLGYEWDIADKLPENSFQNGSPILGTPLGTAPAIFDPGKMGSYFQSASLVAENLNSLNSISPENSADSAFLESAIEMLENAKVADRGLYITF